MKHLCISFLIGITFLYSHAENGYELWLRYHKIENKTLLNNYKKNLNTPVVIGQSEIISSARNELKKGLSGLLETNAQVAESVKPTSLLLAGTYQSLEKYMPSAFEQSKNLGTEGYEIKTFAQSKKIFILAHNDAGVLYGIFHFLRLLQTGQPITSLAIQSIPKISNRILNHWDNLNRTVERGYAGFSIWNWHTLPGYIDQRYIDYARANASIGINGVVLNNVNANAVILTEPYLQKVKVLADVFRPYNLKVYLTARFSAPMEIGHLPTADPLNPQVIDWWNKKVNEIYALIPDFGGFLVKANSEGQPGPQDYKRSHADGANMLARALLPHKGIVMWRAFVYAAENPVDRHMQAYNDFKPLDGVFDKNVILQVKNGAIDFMPREPFHPLFGAMPRTPLMMEFQITQEYTGQGTQLVYLAPLFKEVLESDTYCNGNGSTVAKVIDGSQEKHVLNGIAGVANIGNDINWCGHPFAQANWYAYGRLAWDHTVSSEIIAKEWLASTFTNDAGFIHAAIPLMLNSREAMVHYMNPLGLHHIMGTGHHYGPAPWVKDLKRPEWNPVYYHKADSAGIGFNRTVTGSNALSQYCEGARKQWETTATCNEKFLLWFHDVPWMYKLKNGHTLWNELCYTYDAGVKEVEAMQQKWNALRQMIDAERFAQVKQLLDIQKQEALWWRNACILYFQSINKLPLPDGLEKPNKSLDYYMNLTFPFAPGNG